MPREIGTVVSMEGSIATIHFNRQAACEKCGACGMLKNQSVMELVLAVPPGIKPGDRVALQLDDSFFYFSTLLLYGVPLLCLIAGIALGVLLSPSINAAWDPQLVGAVAGLALAGISYGILRAFNGKFSQMRKRRLTVEKVENE